MTKAAKRPDLVDQVIAYESGQMSDEDAVVFFQMLVDTDMAWTLQGHYGRMAMDLIQRGLVTRKK